MPSTSYPSHSLTSITNPPLFSDDGDGDDEGADGMVSEP